MMPEALPFGYYIESWRLWPSVCNEHVADPPKTTFPPSREAQGRATPWDAARGPSRFAILSSRVSGKTQIAKCNNFSYFERKLQVPCYLVSEHT